MPSLENWGGRYVIFIFAFSVGVGCEYDGSRYAPGETYDATDDCNTWCVVLLYPFPFESSLTLTFLLLVCVTMKTDHYVLANAAVVRNTVSVESTVTHSLYSLQGLVY